MAKQMIRVYQHLEFDVVRDHTLEYGALSGVCSKCKHLNIKIDVTQCPSCQTSFNYIAFQNIKEHLPKVLKMLQEHRDVVFIDYQDFKRIEGEIRARNILG